MTTQTATLEDEVGEEQFGEFVSAEGNFPYVVRRTDFPKKVYSTNYDWASKFSRFAGFSEVPDETIYRP